MSSLTKDRVYHKIVFTNSKKSPRQKAIYFNKKNYNKRTVEMIKVRLDQLYETGKYDPWIDEHYDVLRDDKKTNKKVGEAFQEYLNIKTKKDWTKNTANNCNYLFNSILKFIDKRYEWMKYLMVEDLNDYINRDEDVRTATREYAL